MINLWQLKTSQKATIVGFSEKLEDNYRKRLRDLGFEAEQLVLCLKHPPFGGPRVFQIGDSVFALAKEISQQIQIKLASHTEPEVKSEVEL